MLVGQEVLDKPWVVDEVASAECTQQKGAHVPVTISKLCKEA